MINKVRSIQIFKKRLPNLAKIGVIKQILKIFAELKLA